MTQAQILALLYRNGPTAVATRNILLAIDFGRIGEPVFVASKGVIDLGRLRESFDAAIRGRPQA